MDRKQAPWENPYEHFGRDDVVAEYESFDFLLQPEETILADLRANLADARMLDVGCGAGRTTLHFASLVREYVGIDSSATMVEACRRRFVDSFGTTVSFLTADVRDLDGLASESFDFVLFSFNGLDIVGDHDERLRALREIRRVSRPGATFCFSSHNLSFAQAGFSVRSGLRDAFALARRKPSLLRRPRTLATVVTRPLKWRALNTSPRALARLGHSVIVEERPRYEFSKDFYAAPNELIRIRKYYVRPQAQIDQLAQLGFHESRVFAPDGYEVTESVAAGLPGSWWLYYLCVLQERARA